MTDITNSFDSLNSVKKIVKNAPKRQNLFSSVYYSEKLNRKFWKKIDSQADKQTHLGLQQYISGALGQQLTVNFI